MEKKGPGASAQKLQTDLKKISTINREINYRILNFFTVFAAIADVVTCKKCGSDVKFNEKASRGLGFKIEITCQSCCPILIPSCPYIASAYEINRRLTFAMRMLGIGLSGIKKFCGLMDLPSPVTQSSYDKIVDHIHDAYKKASEFFFRKAVKEEKQKAAEKMKVDDCTDLIVSGDGTWRKRGFTSLYGIASLIGIYSGKVLDIITKSLFCKGCSLWQGKEDTTEYAEWYSEHEKNCSCNHEGSSGKMEVDAVIEMFQRSVDQYGVRYTNYVGDGDSKTFSGITNSKPYGDSCQVKKRECIGHVQKRMGRKLRDLKKKNERTWWT